MPLHKIFFTILSIFVLGTNKGVADKLKDIITDQGLSEKWEVEVRHGPHLGKYWEVTKFPQNEERTYAYPRENQCFDCVILSSWSPETDGVKLTDRLEGWAAGWILSGFSSHFIVTQGQEPTPPTVVQWIDPRRETAKRVIEWKSRAVQVLIQTDKLGAVAPAQINVLRNLVADLREGEDPIDPKCLGDFNEALGLSGDIEHIQNIGEVRKALGLSALPPRAR